MKDKDFFTGSHNPIDYFRSAAYNLAFLRDNPNYFDPDGLICFCGSQGSGKTLSAVLTVKKFFLNIRRLFFAVILLFMGLSKILFLLLIIARSVL